MILCVKKTSFQINKKFIRSKGQVDNHSRQLQINWPFLKSQKRLEIHIATLPISKFTRYTTERFIHKKALSLPRIFLLSDPSVYILYILPYPIPQSTQQYYIKLLNLHDIDPSNRLFFLCPELFSIAPNYTVAQLFYYSSKCLNKAKELIKQIGSAYLVSGGAGKIEYLIANELGIGLYSGDAMLSAELNLKSQSKALFRSLGFPVSPGFVIESNQFKKIDEFISYFASFIISHPEIQSWIFKMDQQKDGRGIATLFLSADQIANILNILDIKELNSQINNVIKVAKSSIYNKQIISCKTVFSDEIEYLNKFIFEGGIVEARADVESSQIFNPTIVVHIEPDGAIQVIGTYDKFQANDFQNIGCFYPQTSLLDLNCSQIAQTLGKYLYKVGVCGFIAIDLCAFKIKGQQYFWTIGLDCYINNYITAMIYFQFLMRGKQFQLYKYLQRYDQKTNRYLVENKQRCFMYFPYLFHPNLHKYTQVQFFRILRDNNIYFDIKNKQGASFLLVNETSCGVLSLITIGENKIESIKIMNDALNSMVYKMGPISKLNTIEENLNNKQQNVKKQYCYLMDIVVSVRQINKQNNEE